MTRSANRAKFAKIEHVPCFLTVESMQIVLSDFQDQLMRGLVHRMNNILSVFHGYVGILMEDKKLDSVTRDGLSRMKSGALAASELMDRTSALVRPVSPAWREVQLSDLLRQLKPTFERLHGPHIELEIKCENNLPSIWADASRVRMGLTELVRNACEAAKHRVTIEVSAEPRRVQEELFGAAVAEPENWVTVRITDDGRGIPAEKAETIYEPFYSTKRKQQGAGLGLTVALGCAQHLGGKLQHHSHPGETTFEFSLPTRISSAGEQPLEAVA